MAEMIPASGAIVDGAHLFPLRVYYEDTDAGGIVYHASYLRFAERARTEFLRLGGWAHDRMVAELGHVWVVRRAEVDYLRPARLDDSLVIATIVSAVTGATIEIRQIIRRGAAELVRIKLKLVLLTPAGRIGRIPAVLKKALTFSPALESTQTPLPAT